MGLLSLPSEILSIICQPVVLAEIGPERRLHPCTNSRYIRKGFQRREHPCPPLLRCCRDLYHIGSEIFYQNVTIVLGIDYHSQPYYFRCYPTPEEDKSTLSVLTGRTSVLPFIQNLELMISRTITYDPRRLEVGRDHFFGCYWGERGDPVPAISTFVRKLPSLKTLGWTVGMGVVRNDSLSIWPHMARNERLDPNMDDEGLFHRRQKWPSPLPHFQSLGVVLKHQPAWVPVTRLRLWLTGNTLRQILHCVSDPPPPKELALADSTTLEDKIAELSSSRFMKAIVQLPNLTTLDVFISKAHPPIGNDLSIIRMKDLLQVVFSHIDQVRFWHARSENVTSGDYEAFEVAFPALNKDTTAL